MNGDIINNTTKSLQSVIGGVVGGLWNVAVTECSNEMCGNIDGYSYCGGVVGYCDNHSTPSNCYNTMIGNITAIYYTGGLIGMSNTGLASCYNAMKGNITGYNYVGGLTGIVDDVGTDTKMSECFNVMIGDIKCTHPIGVAGVFSGKGNCNWEYCYSNMNGNCTDTSTFANYKTTRGFLNGLMGKRHTATEVYFNNSFMSNGTTLTGYESTKGILSGLPPLSWRDLNDTSDWIQISEDELAWSDEIQVNTSITGNQTKNFSSTTLTNDNIVIVWTSENQDGSSNGMYGQILDSEGTNHGAEFLVNETTVGNQYSPRVSALTGGGFVVIWNGAGVGAEKPLYGQRFAEDGTPVQLDLSTPASYDEFVIDSPPHDAQVYGVAGLTNGDFVAVWHGVYGLGMEVKARRYAADGTPSNIIDITSGENFNQWKPSVAYVANGGFVVVWSDSNAHGGAGSNDGVKAALYDSDDIRTVGPIDVTDHLEGAQTTSGNNVSVISLENGNIVVIWVSNTEEQDGDGYGVYGQLYDSVLVGDGDEFQVNTTTIGNQQYASVSNLSNGGFVVVWDSDPTASIKGQMFNSSAIAIGDEFQANVTDTYPTAPIDAYCAVTYFSDERFAVTWQGSDGDGSGIITRIARPPYLYTIPLVQSNTQVYPHTGIKWIGNEKPSITITGDKPAYISKDSSYTDEGVTAYARSGTELTTEGGGLVVDTTNVDESTPGSYTVIYTATDSDGNESTAKRTVVVCHAIINTADFQTIAAGGDYGFDDYYLLQNDLDFTGITLSPIGNAGAKFTGMFFGNDKTISNFVINETTEGTGLFGYIDGGIVQDLTISGECSITGNESVGGICGRLNNGTIKNCQNEMTGDIIIGGVKAVGGICGKVSATTGSFIIECTNSMIGNISTTGGVEESAGGIVGQVNDSESSVTDCQNDMSGNITCKRFAGGICGEWLGEGELNGCYNTMHGKIEAMVHYAGGLIGGSYATVIKCYNAMRGNIHANFTGSGGLIGAVFGGGVTYSFNVMHGNITCNTCWGRAGTLAAHTRVASWEYCYDKMKGEVSNVSRGTPVFIFPGICFHYLNSASGEDYDDIYHDGTDLTDNPPLSAVEVTEGLFTVKPTDWTTSADTDILLFNVPDVDDGLTEIPFILSTGTYFPQSDGWLGSGRPTITLNGDETVYTGQGAAYTDAGATAKTFDDVSIGARLTLTYSDTNLNVNAVGTFYVTYTAEDLTSDTKTVVKRTVIVCNKITTKADLNITGAGLAENYLLMNNIDMSGGDHTPIGTSANPFTGLLHGNGYQLMDVTISGNDFVGIIGYMVGGSILNIGVTGACSISGDDNVGAICGFMNTSGLISGCYNAMEGDIVGKRNVGGICGYLDRSSAFVMVGLRTEPSNATDDEGTIIKNCYNTMRGNIAATGQVIGGILGRGYYNVSISSSYNAMTGDIKGKSFLGGLVGYLYNDSGADGKIADCFNTMSGDIVPEITSGWCGTLCGYTEHAAWSRCYSSMEGKIFSVNGLGFGRNTTTADTYADIVVSKIHHASGSTGSLSALELNPISGATTLVSAEGELPTDWGDKTWTQSTTDYPDFNKVPYVLAATSQVAMLSGPREGWETRFPSSH
jgi:hypothetical protein